MLYRQARGAIRATSLLICLITSVGIAQGSSTPNISERVALADYLNNNSAERPMIKSATQSIEMVNRIHFRVFNVVKEICRQESIPEKNCTWNIKVERQPSFNAYAFGRNEIIIHSGLIDQTASEDEVAFVVAHEIGHHIFRHVYRKQKTIFIGAILGVITGAGAEVGAGVSGLYSLATSSTMERTADRMAAIIISRAGYDESKAKNVLIRMAKMDGRSKTAFLASHPAGLERLYSFETLVKNRASNNEK